MLPVLLLLALTDEQNAREAAYLSELERTAPSAVAPFKEGTERMDKDDWVGAEDAYKRTLAVAPTYAPALRRHCYALSRLGRHVDAVKACRAAVAADPSVESKFILANALTRQRSTPSLEEAQRLVDELLAKDEWPQADRKQTTRIMACEILLVGASAQFPACAEKLGRDFPSSPEALFYAHYGAVVGRDFSTARTWLAQAKAQGLPDAMYEQAIADIEKEEPMTSKYGSTLLVILGVWGAAALVLLLAGSILSALTLREAGRVPTNATGSATGGAATLRKTYKAVIVASCVLYYVSLPFLLVVTVGLGGAAIYGFFALGHIPIKLVFIIVVVVGVTVFAVIKSLFVRPKDEDPGERLDFNDAPKLRALLDEVAQKIGTRPVDNVYLTPGADLAVMERGSFRKRLQGDTERCLILGVGVLDGLSEASFKSVLAHEYGHFSNKDTAGGGLGLSVRMSLVSMAISLAQNGAATWYNPAWWFFRGFFALFLRVSQGATRLQEVLADRWAAFAYGSQAFADGLRHAIRQSIRFDAHANATLKEVIEGQRALANLYAFVPAAPPSDADIEAQLNEVMARQPSPYDSHPAPNDRIKWVQALSVGATETSERTAWDLFTSREALERRMTDQVRSNIAVHHGVLIKAEPA